MSLVFMAVDPVSPPFYLDPDFMRNVVFPVLNVLASVLCLALGLWHRRVFRQWNLGFVVAIIPCIVFIITYGLVLAVDLPIDQVSIYIRPALWMFPTAVGISSASALYPIVKEHLPWTRKHNR